MQVQLTLIATTEQEARSLSGIIDLVNGNLSGAAVQKTQTVEVKALPVEKKKEAEAPKKAKKEKLKAVKEEQADDEDFEAIDDSSDDDDDLKHVELSDDSDDDDDYEEKKPAQKKKEQKQKPVEAPKAEKFKLEDMLKAFKDFALNNSREEAGRILKDFGVKSVRDLDVEAYPKVMKRLKK